MADYIDKNRVDEIIAYHMAHFSPLTSKKDAVTYDALKSLRECVLKVPTANVKEVVRGEWRNIPVEWAWCMEDSDIDEAYFELGCTNCGGLAPLNGCGERYKTAFCPHCGSDNRADMRKEET